MQNLKKRIGSFYWRAGLYCLVAVSAYLANIGNIQDIDLDKLLTIFITTLAVYVGNEGTKELNELKKYGR